MNQEVIKEDENAEEEEEEVSRGRAAECVVRPANN